MTEQAATERRIKNLNWDEELAERAVQWRERADMLEKEAIAPDSQVYRDRCRQEARVWRHCAAVLDDWVARYRGRGSDDGSE